MKKGIALVVISILLTSCNVKPQEINYGEDACHYCSMTIVDRQHSAELVTDKGKAFKFDAIECMIHHLEDTSTPMAFYLVVDFSNPGKLIDANKATFIISSNIPSPMRANLSAIGLKEKAISLQADKGGILYTWDELLTHFE
jgi:copper chaperone NosL